MDRSIFTKVENRMLDVLSDGLPHTREELHACLWDTDGKISNINIHITNMRKKLRPQGQDIVNTPIRRQTMYRQVILLASAYDGYK